MVFTSVERENMIQFILTVFERNFSRHYLDDLTDDNLYGLYKEAYKYSTWGL